MRKKRLEMVLERLRDYESPSPALEQYSLTGSDAATFLWLAKEDVYLSRVVDAGCGSGRLTVGAALLGAWHVVGIDIDYGALITARRNAEDAGVRGFVDFIQCDYSKPCLRGADVVIQNPPFGVQSLHSDRVFIKSSMALADVVYSMHKGGTGRFVGTFFERCGGRVLWVKRHRIALKPTMRHHSKRLYFVDVEIYKVVKHRCGGCR